MRALVRTPGDSFARAVSSQWPRPAIDVDLAREQHREYCAALQDAGVELIELPHDESHPDSCFVQDTAVVWNGVAVMARFGEASREGEQEVVEQTLRSLVTLRLFPTPAPATLEGGDVLVVGTRVVVGLSARTNRAGFFYLRDVLELEGATVEALSVPQGLHLLSGCTYLGQGVLLVTDLYAGLPTFAALELIRVPPEEAYAANALGVCGSVILPGGFPRTASLLRDRGFHVLSVPLTEFAKADGGATCLSLLF